MVEGTSLLRKHMGLNLYRGFDSHRLLQEYMGKLLADKSYSYLFNDLPVFLSIDELLVLGSSGL